MELNDNNLDDFKQDVTQVCHIEKMIKEAKGQIKPIQDRIKELNTRKKELEQDICNTLGANDLKHIQSTEHKMDLEYKVKKSMVPITQKTLKDKYTAFFDEGPGASLSFNSKTGQVKGAELFDYIYGKKNRDYKTKETLKYKDLVA